jgi:hypothetical protein
MRPCRRRGARRAAGVVSAGDAETGSSAERRDEQSRKAADLKAEQPDSVGGKVDQPEMRTENLHCSIDGVIPLSVSTVRQALILGTHRYPEHRLWETSWRNYTPIR